MGLSASQGRMLLLTARKNDLELRAQQISQRRLMLSQQLESVSNEYEVATSNRVMTITARGADSNGSTTTKDHNLSYVALTSGITKAVGGDSTTAISSGYGIVANGASESFNSNGFAVTGLYRLVDVDGAIVVSNANEIPGYSSANDNGAFNYDSVQKNTVNISTPEINSTYSNKITTSVTPSNKLTTGDYVLNANGFVIPYDGSGTNAAVAEVSKDGKAQFSYYKVTIKDGVTDTDLTRLAGTDKVGGTPTQVASMETKPETYLTTTSGAANGRVVQGGDGKYTLYDEKGSVVHRYVVDESLQGGGTSTTEEANYLQDTLRNGLYLIEAGTPDLESNEIKWKKTSYDAISAIADTYYDADDATAKAKYDRLQNQIQSQDKRLEMELDNIETQRSAVTTEVDSVKKVISDNVDKTFKTFNA